MRPHAFEPNYQGAKELMINDGNYATPADAYFAYINKNQESSNEDFKERDKAILADLPLMNPETMDPLLEIIDGLEERTLTAEQKETREEIRKAIKNRNNLLALFDSLDDDITGPVMRREKITYEEYR